ncbi:MAG TPA: hypothetical protein VJ183_19715 [Chloroflexia bacterium]|nr:hypothetical protein [Chloroflexia bacterium]
MSGVEVEANPNLPHTPITLYHPLSPSTATITNLSRNRLTPVKQ